VIPNGARSSASDLVNPTIAALETAYVARRRSGRNTAFDDTLTMRPHFVHLLRARWFRRVHADRFNVPGS
jgi:hypothetical protein